MTRYLLFVLFVATMGSRALGLDLGVAPGISIKNIMLYATFAAIAIESAIRRDRKVELLPVILPFVFLILYALMTWLIVVLFADNPYYLPRDTLIRLKVKLVDHFLMLVVFFYGVVHWKEALTLLRALVWVVVVGCLITVVDSFNIPDLGIIAARSRDGRIEGFIGDAQDFGGILAFVLPLLVAIWWTESGLKKGLALAGIGLGLVSVLLSASRGAMAGIVVGAVLASVYLRRYISARVMMRAATAATMLIVVAVLVVLSTDFGYLLQTRLSTGLETGNLQTLSSGRTAIWSAAWREMGEYPLSFITGLGWEAYYQTIGHRYATHSVYLDRLYNLGVIGLVMFVTSFVNAVSITRRQLALAPPQAAPLLTATIFGLASFMIAMAFSDIHGAALYVWAFTGLAMRVAVGSSGSQAEEDRRRRDQT